ncbi:hypothetical protein HK096_009054, partial [Nowakowskiella sp. JEL0078]
MFSSLQKKITEAVTQASDQGSQLFNPNNRDVGNYDYNEDPFQMLDNKQPQPPQQAPGISPPSGIFDDTQSPLSFFSPQTNSRKISFNSFFQKSPPPESSDLETFHQQSQNPQLQKSSDPFDFFRSSKDSSSFEEIIVSSPPQPVVNSAKQRLEALVKKRTTSLTNSQDIVSGNFVTEVTMDTTTATIPTTQQEELIQFSPKNSLDISLEAVDDAKPAFVSLPLKDSDTVVLAKVTESEAKDEGEIKSESEIYGVRVGNDSVDSHKFDMFEVEGESISVELVKERFAKLKKVESRFAELAKAYKVLQRKSSGIESVLKQTTPTESIQSPADLESLLKYLTNSKVRIEESELEITKLTRRNHELRELNTLESESKAQVILSFQQSLDSKDKQLLAMTDTQNLNTRLKYQLSEVSASLERELATVARLTAQIQELTNVESDRNALKER